MLIIKYIEERLKNKKQEPHNKALVNHENNQLY